VSPLSLAARHTSRRPRRFPRPCWSVPRTASEGQPDGAQVSVHKSSSASTRRGSRWFAASFEAASSWRQKPRCHSVVWRGKIRGCLAQLHFGLAILVLADEGSARWNLEDAASQFVSAGADSDSTPEEAANVGTGSRRIPAQAACMPSCSHRRQFNFIVLLFNNFRPPA